MAISIRSAGRSERRRAHVPGTRPGGAIPPSLENSVGNQAPRLRRLIGLSSALLFLPGCWTSHLMTVGQQHESIVAFDRIAQQGDVACFEYTARITKRVDPEVDGTETRVTRTAVVSLADLTQQPAIPVEHLSIRRLSGDRCAEAINAALPASDASPFVASIVERDGVPHVVDFCWADSEGCPGRFYPGALYQRSLEWWVYPVLPVTIAVDIAVLPFQIVTLPILIVISD